MNFLKSKRAADKISFDDETVHVSFEEHTYTAKQNDKKLE